MREKHQLLRAVSGPQASIAPEAGKMGTLIPSGVLASPLAKGEDNLTWGARDSYHSSAVDAGF